MPRQSGELAICRDVVELLRAHLPDYLRAVREDDSELAEDDLPTPDPTTGYVVGSSWVPPGGRASAITVSVSSVETPSQWRSPAGPLRQTVRVLVRWYLTTTEQRRIDELRYSAGRALRECLEANWQPEASSSSWILRMETGYTAAADAGGDLLQRDRLGLPRLDHVRVAELRITFSQIQPAALR